MAIKNLDKSHKIKQCEIVNKWKGDCDCNKVFTYGGFLGFRKTVSKNCAKNLVSFNHGIEEEGKALTDAIQILKEVCGKLDFSSEYKISNSNIDEDLLYIKSIIDSENLVIAFTKNILHLVIIKGYDFIESKKFLYLIDPFPVHAQSLFNYFQPTEPTVDMANNGSSNLFQKGNLLKSSTKENYQFAGYFVLKNIKKETNI